MNTRHLAAIKSSELRHHYFNELGATKLACVWVLEHLGKSNVGKGPLVQRLTAPPRPGRGDGGKRGRFGRSRLWAAPAGGVCPRVQGPNIPASPAAPAGAWTGVAGMPGLPGRYWAAPRAWRSPGGGCAPGV